MSEDEKVEVELDEEKAEEEKESCPADEAKAAGRGRMGGPVAGGPGGECVCPKCGETITHDRAEPCMQIKCSKCGTLMTRKG